jgi:hypothetical protein
MVQTASGITSRRSDCASLSGMLPADHCCQLRVRDRDSVTVSVPGPSTATGSGTDSTRTRAESESHCNLRLAWCQCIAVLASGTTGTDAPGCARADGPSPSPGTLIDHDATTPPATSSSCTTALQPEAQPDPSPEAAGRHSGCGVSTGTVDQAATGRGIKRELASDSGPQQASETVLAPPDGTPCADLEVPMVPSTRSY